MDYKEKYIKQLAERYKTIPEVSAEIVNLMAIQNLPKGTEHFVSDIHGEYEMFLHIVKTASGVIKRKIDEEFGEELSEKQRAFLATLIYYPKEKLELCKDKDDAWRKEIINLLARVCKKVSAKYTRSKVRKLLPPQYAYIMDELLNCNGQDVNKEQYYSCIVDSIISLGQGADFIIEMCNVVQSLAVDHIHIVGDIFDRGPRADIIMDYLQTCRSIDIQWGNHDVLWIGAGLGDIGCILTVLCDCFKYENFDILEDGYGINIVPIYTLASKKYQDSNVEIYKTGYNSELSARLLKAITILKLKIEDIYRKTYPEFNMESQTILDKINFRNKSWKNCEMRECDFPTIDPTCPTALCDEEKEVVEKLVHSFTHSEKLNKHLDFLMKKGSMYLCYNGNLLFHGSIPLDENGEFLSVPFYGKSYKGKAYLDFCDEVIRRAFKLKRKEDLAFIWQLWCGNKSPIFGKDKMTTFERLYIADKTTHKETKQYYFSFQDNIIVCNNILREFGLDTKIGRIINGHIPVKHAEGESPIKAKGKMLVIDGGMSKPYQKVTGIAGYTLTYHSFGMGIASHTPFLGKDEIVKNDAEVLTEDYVVSRLPVRIKVADTDIGKALQEQIADLKELLERYRSGKLKK